MNDSGILPVKHQLSLICARLADLFLQVTVDIQLQFPDGRSGPSFSMFRLGSVRQDEPSAPSRLGVVRGVQCRCQVQIRIGRKCARPFGHAP